MRELKELLNWASTELQMNSNEINIRSKELLIACIKNKKDKYIKLFVESLWDEELIDLYLDNTTSPMNIKYYYRNSSLTNYYLLGLLKRKFYNEYLDSLYIPDETNEMRELFFSDLENADLDYELVNSKGYFNEKERLKKAIEKGRLDLLLNVIASSFDEEVYTLLEGKMSDLDIAYKFFEKTMPYHFLINHNHKLFKELINNRRFEYLEFIRTEYIEKAMEDQEMYDYIINLLFSLPDTQEYNKFFQNKVINNDPSLLKRLIKEERITYLTDQMYFLKNVWTKENQKLYYEARKNNPSFPIINTNYSVYIESYINKPLSDKFYRAHYVYNIDENKNLNDINTVISIAEDLHNNVIQTENIILKKYYEFIYQTKSPRIFNLINYLIDKDVNKLNLLFNELGLTEYFKEQLLYDQDYLIYCFKNGIDVLSGINNINYISYTKLIVKYQNITKCVVIMEDNLEEYINNGKITRKLINNLFNEKGYNTLLSMLENNENLDLTNVEIYALNKSIELKNDNIRLSFLKYCIENSNDLTIEKVDRVAILIERVINNNSDEIRKKANEVISEILKYHNSESRLEEIEDVFDEDNIPEFAKRFVMYKMLFSKNLIRSSIHSPMLSSMSDEEIDKTVLFDLFKISLGSFDYGLINYLEELTSGELLYRQIKMKSKTIVALTKDELELLNRYRRKIDFISRYVYNFKVDKVKTDIDSLFYFEEQLKDRINYPKKLPLMGTLNLIVKELFEDYGFTSMFDVDSYAFKQLIFKTAFEEGRYYRNEKMKIEDGDFLKSVKSEYLDNILQYGSICQEMLGEDANRDATHMDTDMSIIRGENLTIPDVLAQRIEANSGWFGDIKLVLSKEYMEKCDKCIISKKGQSFTSSDKAKTEIFAMFGGDTDTHYGIRTGFPSMYIKAIIADNYISSLKFKIVRSGFYIPIYNSKGNLEFSYDEYRELTRKKDGLKKYHNSNYELSENLETKEIIDISNTLLNNVEDISRKKQAIFQVLNEVFKKYFNGVKYKLDGSITSGFVEIFDTGSTGRGTSVPKDNDFDFIIRVDKEFKYSPMYNHFVSDIYKAFNKTSGSDSIRIEKVDVPGINEPLDIDITIIEKTNKVTYSTDECIKDRLSTIKEKYKGKYNLVISNIIMAKKILKEAKAYKPRHARKNPEGGLGGVGVENWILQNGGSLLDAAESFLKVAEECENNLTLFQQKYPIYDFGENHMHRTLKKYPYDNFVFNLDQSGFEKIVNALKQYMLNHKIDFTDNNAEILKESIKSHL